MEITIQGFKSLRDERTLPIAPLTLLAGANSSGKSSALQPLLLLKQTLEVGYDPGPLLLNGPNARFSTSQQLLWQGKRRGDRVQGFRIGLREIGEAVDLYFRRPAKGGIELERMVHEDGGVSLDLHEGMSDAELNALDLGVVPDRTMHRKLERARCAFTVSARRRMGNLSVEVERFDLFARFAHLMRSILHLPGLRGNPERAYPTSQVGEQFPGLFPDYVASVVAAWKEAGDARLEALGEALSHLGLTWKVEPRRLDDTRVELRVGRLASPGRGGAKDLVNVADVGFGVSQTLPVVVALLTAQRGQIVILEQPEIHLHPRAQVALAKLLLDAARRGVLVMAETHSHLLLKSVQRAVASGEVPPSLVKLHWFQRDDEGATHVSTANLDEQGTYGDWPEDFGDVELEVEDAFLSASMGRRAS